MGNITPRVVGRGLGLGVKAGYSSIRVVPSVVLLSAGDLAKIGKGNNDSLKVDE